MLPANPLMAPVSPRDPSTLDVEFIGDVSGLPALAEVLEAADTIAVDTETHDAVIVDGIWAALRVISVAVRLPGGSYRMFVVDARDVPPAAIAPLFAPLHGVLGWNANFDAKVLSLAGCAPASWRDLMLEESVLWNGVDGRGWYSSLSAAASRYVGYDMDGKGTTQTSFDGSSDLSEAQVRYAGEDAIITLWVGEALDAQIAAHQVGEATSLESGARPFIAHMMDTGIPFEAPGWLSYLDRHRAAQAEALARIAELTGGGELTLFDQGGSRPTFNVESDPQLREAFNRWAPAAVQARFGRLFERTDRLDKAALKELSQDGCELADQVLAYRGPAKLLSTYGEKLMRYVRGGRIRSRYKQALTATGRLSSSEPNAQNFDPAMKAFIAPAPGRVLVTADYSQAELRVLANLADEPKMIEAFISGEDFHELTAAEMFGIDMAALKAEDPKGYKVQRTKTKRVNFGIPYGLGAAALGRQLTLEGVPTSRDEAQSLLDSYDRTYTKVAAWLGARDQFVKSLADNPGPIDWESSFKLLGVWLDAEPARNAFKRANKRYPTASELSSKLVDDLTLASRLSQGTGAEPTPAALAEARAAHVADLAWAFRYDAPVVLRPGGEPLAWESRTVAGRRRLFMVPMDSGYKRSEDEAGNMSKTTDQFAGLITSAMLIAATSEKPVPCAIRDEWASAHGVDLPSGTDRLPVVAGESKADRKERAWQHRLGERARCVKAFEGADGHRLKLAFVQFVRDRMGPDGADRLLDMALRDQIGKLGNAFRNHPIQGTVADIVLAAFGELFGLTASFDGLVFAQSVHDSIVAECDADDAPAVASAMKSAMETAMSRFCPAVPAKVDVEIRTSLADSDVVWESDSGLDPRVALAALVEAEAA